jgi:nucleoside permease NupC
MMARPERREEIIVFGPKTIVSGTLSTCTVGVIVGIPG